MRAKTLTAAFLLATAALAFVPSTTALESPPQCQAIGSGCCGIGPAFAPCCSVLECPPPLVRCPETSFDSTSYLQLLGPWVTAVTHDDCSAQVCLQTATCCVIDGRDSFCSSLAPESSASADQCPSHREPVFGVFVDVDEACAVTVSIKQYDCVWNCGWHTYVQGPPVTVRVYQQNGPEESSASSSPPTCTQWEIASEGLPATVGVRSGGDCRYGVSVTDPQCPKPTQPGGDVHADGVVSVWAETCQLSVDCTCDPLPLQVAAASLPDLFPECPGMGSCCGIEPAEGGCGPSAPACPEKAVSTTQFFGFIGPHVSVAIHSDCTVEVAEFGLPCPSLAPDPGAIDRTVGPVQVHADTCVPDLDCTCPPLAVAAAAIPPPVEVEWVVCVTEPCDSPRITCHIGPRDLPGFNVEVSESCHVTVTQDPLACEGMRYESTTVGQVTVRRAYCGPGIDP